MHATAEDSRSTNEFEGHQNGHSRTVDVHVNNQKVVLHSGRYEVKTFKKVAGVPQADDLEKLVNCKLDSVPDDGTIDIERGKSSSRTSRTEVPREMITFPEDQIAELKLLCPDVAQFEEASCPYLPLPGLCLPEGCKPARTGRASLSVWPRRVPVASILRREGGM